MGPHGRRRVRGSASTLALVASDLTLCYSIGWDWALPIVPYGDKFKRHRKYLQEYLKKPRLPNYYPIQLHEVHKMLNDVLDDPENYKAYIKRMAAGITMMMTYGHEVKSLDDHYVNLAERGVATIEAVGAVGAHIVDLLPPREHPGPYEVIGVLC